jgi:pathogenesis-related protein 1
MKKLATGALIVPLFLILQGCGGGGGSSDNTTTTKTADVSGAVIDGPISTAKVCLDLNFNGTCDSDEPTATTDENGTYTLPKVDLNVRAPILVEPIAGKTIDTYTLKPFTKKLSAPFEGTTTTYVTPITTIVGGYMYKLKAQGSLDETALEKVKEAVAQSLGLSPDTLCQVDIRKYPKVYATSVILAQTLPTDPTQIDQAVDFQTLEKGDLVNAVKDETAQENLQIVQENDFSNNDPLLIQKAIEYSLENGTTFDPQQVTALGIAEFLNNNRIFQPDGTELVISGNSFTDYSTGTPLTGTWEANGDSIVFSYSDGTKISLTGVKPLDLYSWEITYIDGSGKVTSKTTIALPKDKPLNQLRGITLFGDDLTNGGSIVGDNVDLTLTNDGSMTGTLDGVSLNGSWKINNGVLELSWTDSGGNAQSGQFVLYNGKLLGVYTSTLGSEIVNKALQTPVKITPATSTLVVPMSADEIQAGLDLTNQYREEVGVGPLTWNEDLAKGSEAWAAYLAQLGTLQHSSGDYGENLYYYGTTGDQVATLSDAVNAWQAEKAYYLGGAVGADDYCEEGKVCGHYTQQVWSTTTEMGCGKAVIQDGDWKKTFIVCRYLPAGNIVGEKPYDTSE